MGRWARVFARVAGVATGLLVALLVAAQAAFPTGGSPAPGQGPAALAGSVPAVVAAGRAQQTGQVAPGQVLHLAVVLRVRNTGDLDQLLAGLGRGQGRPVSPGQARKVFDPTADTETQVIDWLRGGGLSVEGTYPNRTVVDATGTAAQVDRLLHTSLHTFRGSVNGHERSFYANTTDLHVPGHLAGKVAAVLGVDDMPVFSTGNAVGSTPASTASASTSTSSSGPPYGPNDFARAYDVNPVWNAGTDGRGQHIGITLWTEAPSDAALTRFASLTGAKVATRANGRLHVIPVGSGKRAPDEGEAALDVEYASGLAPGAHIDFYQATDSGFAALTDALNAAGTATDSNGAPLDRQISSSWGATEPSSASAVAGMEQVLAANTATGHTYLFSSGDNGSWAQNPTSCTGADPWPDYPASSDYVTSVGGTRLSGAPSGGWPGESSWRYRPTGSTCGGQGVPEGSGGGYSRLFARPSWQTTSGLAANGSRAYPDVAADADPGTGALVALDTSSGVQLAQIGGTSLASPLWAGMTADLNSYLIAAGRTPVGPLAPTLYGLLGTTQPYPALHDITSGSNGSYHAGAGWDAVTGLGSPDLYALARDLADGATPPDITPPTVTLHLSSNHGYLQTSRAALRWSGTDTGPGGGTGIADYDLRWRSATKAGALGTWQHPSAWQHTTTTSATGPAQTPGLRYCFAVRARDRAGNVTAWSKPLCAARVVDDRSLAATKRWRRATGAGYYQGTSTSTSTKGQALTFAAPAASQVGVLATVCPSCGSVTVYQGSRRLGVLHLAATTPRREQLRLLPFGIKRSGEIRLVVGTAGKTVDIDGLALTTR